MLAALAAQHTSEPSVPYNLGVLGHVVSAPNAAWSEAPEKILRYGFWGVNSERFLSTFLPFTLVPHIGKTFVKHIKYSSNASNTRAMLFVTVISFELFSLNFKNLTSQYFGRPNNLSPKSVIRYRNRPRIAPVHPFLQLSFHFCFFLVHMHQAFHQ